MDNSLYKDSHDSNLNHFKLNTGVEIMDKEEYSLSIQPGDVLLLPVECGVLPADDMGVRQPCRADAGEP